jgi:hypothetical protein
MEEKHARLDSFRTSWNHAIVKGIVLEENGAVIVGQADNVARTFNARPEVEAGYSYHRLFSSSHYWPG